MTAAIVNNNGEKVGKVQSIPLDISSLICYTDHIRGLLMAAAIRQQRSALCSLPAAKIRRIPETGLTAKFLICCEQIPHPYVCYP